MRRLQRLLASAVGAVAVGTAAVSGGAPPEPEPAAEERAAPQTPADLHDEPEEDETAHEGPADPLDRGVPRSAMRGYLEAARAGDWERAAGYLDLRRVPVAQREELGHELARQLKVVLDRSLWVDLDALSNDPAGDLDDGLPDWRDEVGEIATPGGPVPVLLQRVPREDDDARIWKIAAATVDRVPQLYGLYGYGVLDEILPRWMLDVHFLEVALWQWIALLVLVPLAFGLAWLLIFLVAALARPLAKRTHSQFDDRVVNAAARPLRLAAATGLYLAGTRLLGLALPAQDFLEGLAGVLLVVAVTWFAVRMVNVFTLLMLRRLETRGNGQALPVLSLAQRVLKVLVVFLGGIAMLDQLGFSVTAVLAGLGVGGIAVALAAQKSIENLFGGITLFADRPIAVGDFGRFGDRVGTVEEIGLRSTRVRTLDRTLVTIPNADFSSMAIESFTARDRIWYNPTLGLRYETTPEQLRYVLVEVRRMLFAHPMVDAEPARVRFKSFGAYSLDLEVFAYVLTTDYNEYLGVAEDLNLRIMDIVEASGSAFAFPSQTLYLGRDEGLDEKRVAEAEAEVRAWRERRELFLPKFPQEAIAGVDDSLDWPPEGSPDGDGRRTR